MKRKWQVRFFNAYGVVGHTQVYARTRKGAVKAAQKARVELMPKADRVGVEVSLA